MARIKIDIPEDFSFFTDIPVCIRDINYGGHLGNDALLSILHGMFRLQATQNYTTATGAQRKTEKSLKIFHETLSLQSV